jgi:hypothetical protein
MKKTNFLFEDERARAAEQQLSQQREPAVAP